MSRRALLRLAACAPLAGALPRPATAELQLGSATLSTVSDGNLILPGSFIFDAMPQAELADILNGFGLPQDRLMPECNLALYRDGTNTVLFDVGAGPDFMLTAGEVSTNLDALGITPEDVTHVVFTHAHPDHIWGLLDDFDDPVFYNATYMMGPETVNTIGEARAAFAVGAKRRMRAIEDQVQLFDGGAEILPGIAAFACPGHTPGHMAFEVRQGANAALIVGDAIGNHHVAFRRPDWESGSDQDMALAVQSRRVLFDRLVNEDMTLVGFHLPDGGIVRAVKDIDGFRFVGEATQ